MSVFTMMSLCYAEKYFVACYLVLFLVINAAAEISLAQYFGTDKVLSSESDRFVQACDTEEMQKRCYEQCGRNHACLPGQCICYEDMASPVKYLEIQQVESSEEKNRGAEIGNENESREIVNENESRNKNVHESKTLQCLINQYRKTEENSKTASSGESNSVEGNLVPRPALRHHIAHFCPNLDKARVCIKKCMELNLPAFCGKDHVCYCGHKEGDVDVRKLVESHRNQTDGKFNPFRDLYERYFGPPQ